MCKICSGQASPLYYVFYIYLLKKNKVYDFDLQDT